MIQVTVAGADLAGRYLEEFGKAIPAATTRALNRAIRFGLTTARRGIVAETGLQTKYITPSLKLALARPENLAAAINVIAVNIPLLAYFRTGFKSGLGIGGRPYALSTAPPRAFFAQFKSGHRGVYERRGRARGLLRQLSGPPIPRVIAERHVFEAMRGVVTDTYEKRLAHELTRVLERRTDASDG